MEGMQKTVWERNSAGVMVKYTEFYQLNKVYTRNGRFLNPKNGRRYELRKVLNRTRVAK